LSKKKVWKQDGGRIQDGGEFSGFLRLLYTADDVGRFFNGQ